MAGERKPVASISGAALDFAVAHAIGLAIEIHPPIYGTGPRLFADLRGRTERWWPSADWTQGGQLLGLFDCHLRSYPFEDGEGRGAAGVFGEQGVCWQAGATPLIALCRAVVAVRLGEIVDLPVEVLR